MSIPRGPSYQGGLVPPPSKAQPDDRVIASEKIAKAKTYVLPLISLRTLPYSKTGINLFKWGHRTTVNGTRNSRTRLFAALPRERAKVRKNGRLSKLR